MWAAWDMAIRLHSASSNWSALLQAGEQLGHQRAVPAWLAGKMTVALLSMPDSAATLRRRTQLGWRLQSCVAPFGRSRPAWKLTAAALHLADKSPTPAEHLAREVLRGSPNHVNGRYLLARSLCLQGRHDKARPILDRLAGELPGVPVPRQLPSAAHCLLRTRPPKPTG